MEVPKDLPPKSTVPDCLELWNWDGTLERIHHALYVAVREQAGREASPTVAIIDSQTAKGAQKGGPWLDPSGYDAGKKIKSGTSRSTHDDVTISAVQESCLWPKASFRGNAAYGRSGE